jgi:putative membrane protein
MRSPLSQLLVRWLVLALGVALATRLVPGIRCDDGTTLAVVVVLLSFCNAIFKPLLVLFTLPFILLTMGLGMIVINALLFYFVGHVVAGFHVDHFRSAVGGALVVSITHFVAGLFLRRRSVRAAGAARPKADDVIDI